MKYGSSLVAASFVLAVFAGDATSSERARCRSGGAADDPMTTSESFGLALCDRRSAPRYHRDDYSGRPQRRMNSEDPMVWDARQWSGSLMTRFARGTDSRVDRRFRVHDGDGMVEIQIRRTIAERWVSAVQESVERARPQVRVFGGNNNKLGARAPFVRAKKETCGGRGPAILVWTGARAERACAPVGVWRGRIRAPSEDLSLDKG
jgi:hypothetical protein